MTTPAPTIHRNPLHALYEKGTWIGMSVAFGAWAQTEDNPWKHYLMGATTLCAVIAAVIRNSATTPPETTDEPQS